MPKIVDGDNLLGSWAGKDRSQRERLSLAHRIHRFSRLRRKRIVVVFDGISPSQTLPPDVLFSGSEKSADKTILTFLENRKNKRGWTVITDDRSLADQCRLLGVPAESCRVFRQALWDRPDEDKPNAGQDIDYWRGVFNREDDEQP